jgi:hexokinase
MLEIQKKVKSFLKSRGMDPDSVDLEKNSRMFVEEMQAGLTSKSSLLMLPTYISMERELPVNETVIVVDAGGTNFRVAAVHFDEGKKPVVEDFEVYPMPGTKGEISREDFFDTMAGYLMPVLDRSSKISFCFSYPVEILPNKDGRLIKFSKEIRAKEVEGQLICENLLKAVKKLGCKDEKSIVLLNDTVATLLAGKASAPDRIFDSYIGFILGTGTNTCYIEKSGNIEKVPALKISQGTMLINVESGGYGKAPMGELDAEFDGTTANPGHFSFEKAISGAYQGGLILTVIRSAAREGLFTKEFAEALSGVKELSSKEIDDFLFYPYSDNTLANCCRSKVPGHTAGESHSIQEEPCSAFDNGEADRLTLYYLIDAIIERAAKFVTFNLTACMMKIGRGSNPCAPVCITVDGSTFYKSKLFRSKLDYYVRTFTNDRKHLYCEFVKVDNGTLIGTAIAGLLN